MQSPKPALASRRVVIKLGTGVLTSGVGQLDEPRIAAICAQLAALHGQGVEVIVVTSGAIGLGMGRLGLARAYVAIGMPDWFHKHLITMDSALAARLKAQATG